MSGTGRAKASGPKPDQEALVAQRKEKYGFANLAKEQQFRSTAQGEAKALQDKVRELTDMLEDRKNANRLLNAENQRLKKTCQDLQFQMLNKPTSRGESAALKSMREMARQFKSGEEMAAATAEKLSSDLELQTQKAMEEMQLLSENRDRLDADLQTTREELSAVTAQRDDYQRETESLMEEKEDLIRQAIEQDDMRQQKISALETEVEELNQAVAKRDAAAEVARQEAEAALRNQKAALEAEALLQRQAAVAELKKEVADLKKLLDKAHESLRSLNQTEALGPGWQLHELGLDLTLPPPTQPPALPAAEPSATSVHSIPMSDGAADSAAAPEPGPPGFRQPSRRTSRPGSVAGSAAGSVAAAVPPAIDIGADGALERSLSGSAAGSLQMEHSGDLPNPTSTASAAGSVRGSRGGGGASGRGSVAGVASRPPSVAASVRSVRASRTDGDGGSADAIGAALASAVVAAAAARSAGDDNESQSGGAVPEGGQSMDGGNQEGEGGDEDDASAGGVGAGSGGGSRAASVAGLRRDSDVAVASRGGSRRTTVAGGPRGGSRPGSVASAAAAPAAADSPAGSPRGGPAAAAAKGASGAVPAAPPTPRGNVLELLLHDASLDPGVVGLPASDLWALLRLHCPGIGLVNVGLSARPPSSGGAGSSTLPLLHAYRLHFPDDQALLTAVAAGSARLTLHNLRPAVVGAFGCPRLAPTSGTDGTLERVMVVASRDEYGCSSLDLYCMDEEGRPTRHFQALSAPWRQQLPDSFPPPQPHEFCIDTHSLHRLQADAARASGLFDTASRVFLGRSDSHMYQVWRLAAVDTRRKASFKALDRVLVDPAEDPWAAAAPLAGAALPLTAALSAPTLTRLELNNVRMLLGDQPVVRLYDPSDDIATKTLACRTTAGEKLVCSVRVTARLARDPEVSEQLLAALQPALQAGMGVPTLPPLHWLSLLGGEELVLERLLAGLWEALSAAVGRAMALPVLDEASEQELERVLRGAEDAVLLKQRQLEDSLASCAVVVAAASKANPQDGPLARDRLGHIRLHIARSLAELLAFFRQRLELFRLGAAAWHFITSAASDGRRRLNPVARTPTTTTVPQAQRLADLLRLLAGVLQALAPPGVTAAELLAAAAAGGGGGSAATVPLVLLLPPPAAAATVVAAPPLSGALSDAAGGLEAVLSAAVAAASVAAEEAFEALRREVAMPGVDDVAAVTVAQEQLAATVAPVTAGLVAGMAGLCQAAIAASLSEPETVAALRQQLMAAATAAAPGIGLDAAGMEQLVLRLRLQAAVAAGMEVGPAVAVAAAGDAGPPAGRAASQLGAALKALQWLAGNMTRAAPAPVAASPHSVGPWLKASVRLRLQLGVLCTAWSATAVAAAGHALLLCGQRQAAARLVLEVMGREVDRVLDFIKATLESIRANRSYDESVLNDCMPVIATALTAHAATAVTACFWMAAQMLMTPLLVLSYPRQHYIQAAAVAAAAAAKAAASAVAAASDVTAAPPPTGSAVAAAGIGGGDSGGTCYSSSLHITSHESFTLVTLGSISVGNQATAVAMTHRPPEPSLAPLSHPLLSSWQPLECVLYLDVGRLNAAAAAVAAGTPMDAAPPADTAGLPYLPAAAELLGWTVRHGEEFYHAHVSAAATAADRGTDGAGGSGPGSVAAASATAASGSAVAPLAVDPVVALSEARLAADMAKAANVVVVAGGRLAEARSMVKWLTQCGVLVLEAATLQLPGSGGGDGDGAARKLAQTLVGLTATHRLQVATVQALTQASAPPPPPSAAVAASAVPTPRPGSRPVTRRGSISSNVAAADAAAAPASPARTPRASLSGSVAPGARTPQPPTPSPATPSLSAAAPSTPTPPALQPLAVVTYLPDVTVAKPVHEACKDLSYRVDRSLEAIQAAFAAVPAVAPHSDMLVRHVSRQLKQQALLLEGLLIAPELVRDKHPGTVLFHSSPTSSGLSRMTSSRGSVRPELPPMIPMRPELPPMPSRRTSLSSGPASPPRPPPAPDADSTESEDEEVGVSRIAPRPLPQRAGARPPSAASRLLPDEPDADSDAASIRSTSTLGSTLGGRGAQAGGR